MIKVLIADDQPLVRSGLRSILAAEQDFGSLGEAENSERAVERLQEEPWDVLILGISIQVRGGIDALSQIRKRWPELPILVLGFRPEEREARLAIRAGANGYLTKSDPTEESMRAIRRILSGKRYISPTVAETLVHTDAPKDPADRHTELSTRELQVMCMIASGKTVSEIARETHLSVKTVSTYRARALEKMHMRNNAEFTRYAIEKSLVG